MAKTKRPKLTPVHAAITAAQLCGQVIGSVQGLAEFARQYPEQVAAAERLFLDEQRRILVLLKPVTHTKG